MKRYNFKQAVEEDMIITGGHFTLTPDDSSINTGTLFSFRNGAELFATERSNYSNLGFGILINDIGTVCSSSHCQAYSVAPRDRFSFPKAYVAILDEFGIDKNEIVIFWEKHVRNRAKKQLHALVSAKNPSIFYQEKEGYFYRSSDDGAEIILTRYHKGDETGTPACPLIMGAYSSEHCRMGYTSSLNFYYVGEDNYMNVANHFVIEKGRFLASLFNPRIKHIKNVYLFQDKHLKNF